MELLEEIETRVVIGDGAMGTQLFAAGAQPGECLEEWCVTKPEIVQRIHEQYIAAGARLIETNSFGANAARLAQFGHEHRVAELNWTAAQIAKAAAKGRDVCVAGGVGPLGVTHDRKRLFEDQIGALLDGGVQVIVFETFQSLEEILVAVEVKHSLHHCPVVCCLACDDTGLLPDGTTLATAFARLRAADADIVGINCNADPRALPALFDHAPPLAAFPSAGVRHDLSPAAFAEIGCALAARGVRLIGGCCGTTPAHIAAFADALRA